MTVSFDHLTTWHLANLADCVSPDKPDRYGFDPSPDGLSFDPSPGARFLRSVADSTAEAIDYAGEDFDLDEFTDDAHDIADAAVPVYTGKLWATFVDLAAYNEDPSELGGDTADMERLAGICLYMIGARLADALAREWAEEHADDESEEA